MITFFTIFFIILGINVAMMLFSLNTVGQKKKSATDVIKSQTSEIFPIDLLSSKYKKAV
jgi:hypothetical protein